jgi:hypothetical protein
MDRYKVDEVTSRNDAHEGKVGVPWHGFESRTYSFLFIKTQSKN